MPYNLTRWINPDELAQFEPADPTVPCKEDWQRLFADIHDWLKKFGIENDVGGETWLGLRSESHDLFLVTPTDPEDRRIVVGNKDLSGDDNRDLVTLLRCGARVVWSVNVNINNVIAFMKEIDGKMEKEGLVHPLTGERSYFRLKQS